MNTALVTGGSRGFGRAIVAALNDAGWQVVTDARDAGALEAARTSLAHPDAVIGLAGDIGDAAHRDSLVAAVKQLARLDLLVNNASELGPSPLPALAGIPLDSLRRVYEVNVLAPLALVQQLLPELRESGGAIVNVTSDAAVEAYAGWGGYGSSKAALDQVSAVLAAENTGIRVYAFDPGDMRTDMHQAAFPGEDISDRPAPEVIVPSLMRLLSERPVSGRYRAADVLATPATPA